MAGQDSFLFVSHVAEDRSAAMEIVAELERRGQRCWIAPRDVQPGKPFDDEIADALEGSLAMLLIFSERCNDSEYIRREITVAGESKKPVIPFRIEDVQPRRGLRVRLSDLHWIDAFVSRERGIDEVVKTLAEPARPASRADADGVRREIAQRDHEPAGRATAEIAERPGTSKPAGGRSPNRRPVVIAGAVAAVLIAGVVFMTSRWRDDESPSPAERSPGSAAEKGDARPAADTQEAGGLVRRGEADLANKDYDLAIADFNAAIRLDPKLAAAFNKRGVAYYEKHDYDRAIADHTEAIRLDPKYSDAFVQRGMAYAYGKKDSDRGIEDFSEAIRLDSKSAAAFFNRGVVYAYPSTGTPNNERAIKEYTEAIRLSPNYSEAYFFRGVAYQNGTQFDRAIADYGEATRLNPDYGIAFSNRASIYQSRKDYDRAIADYTQAIRVLPRYAAAFYGRGLSRKQAGDDAGGEADIAKARELDPNVGK